MEEVRQGVQAAYAALVTAVQAKHGTALPVVGYILYIRLPLSNSPFGNHRVQVNLYLARSCLSYPAENALCRCCVKTVLEVIAPPLKMRNLLVQRISNKPSIRRHTISRPGYQRLCNKILTVFDTICNNFLCYYHVVCNKILAFQGMVCSLVTGLGAASPLRKGGSNSLQRRKPARF